MKTYEEIIESIGCKYKVLGKEDDGCALQIFESFSSLCVISSWGLGWDHVSVHTISGLTGEPRTPFWDEMCRVKDIFFHDEECVVQYHPPKSEYKNDHPHVLHLWLSQTKVIETPPLGLV